MVWMMSGREWPFGQSQNLGLNVAIFGTHFGQSRTENGPYVLYLCVMACCLNNMQIVCRRYNHP